MSLPLSQTMYEFMMEAMRFADENKREKRPYQRLLMQNRFELSIGRRMLEKGRKKLAEKGKRPPWYSERYFYFAEKLVHLITFVELPKFVRRWFALYAVAQIMTANKKKPRKWRSVLGGL